MQTSFKTFLIRDWRPADRQAAAGIIGQVLTEYGLGWEPEGADSDVIQVETHYQGGEFWVVEQAGQLVGTAAYLPIERGEQAVEIRKMYLLPAARGQGLGGFLLGSWRVRSQPVASMKSGLQPPHLSNRPYTCTKVRAISWPPV